MEMFIVRLVEKVHQWQDNTRFCFTRDVYELCFAELLKVLPLPHSDHVKVFKSPNLFTNYQTYLQISMESYKDG